MAKTIYKRTKDNNKIMVDRNLAVENILKLPVIDATNEAEQEQNAIGIKNGNPVYHNGTALVPFSSGGGGTANGNTFKNKLLNGNFEINEREILSGTNLSAGVYFFDQWFAESTFVLNFESTGTDAGNILVLGAENCIISQKIEDINLFVGDYTLSWYGNVTPSSSHFTVSEISAYVNENTRRTARLHLSTWTKGTHPQITFTGTSTRVAKIQLEEGLTATDFGRKPQAIELKLCQRYCYKVPFWNARITALIRPDYVVTNEIQMPLMYATPTVADVNVSMAWSLSHLLTGDTTVMQSTTIRALPLLDCDYTHSRAFQLQVFGYPGLPVSATYNFLPNSLPNVFFLFEALLS